VGNPPYQEDDNGFGASAKPIYNLFIDKSKAFTKYLLFITPSKWFSGGKGLDKFRDSMLKDDRIRIIHDYLNPKDVFSNVQVEGGVSYFLWNRDESGLCKIHTHSKNKIISVAERPLLEEGLDFFIRYNDAIPILKKISNFKEKTFSDHVISTHFNFSTAFKNFNLHKYDGAIKLYARNNIGYVDVEQIKSGKYLVDKWKVYISEAYGGSNIPHQIINKPFKGEPNSCCTQTYILIGPFSNEKECENVISYISTKFFRFLVMLKKNTQHVTVYFSREKLTRMLNIKVSCKSHERSFLLSSFFLLSR
jgi:site-specific DNA-methyltransferase (adenine-specific)